MQKFIKMEQFESLQSFNIYSTCRTCLENVNTQMHYDIFAKSDLQLKLIKCISLPVEPGDGFPLALCESCYTKINEFYIFQQMCILTRKIFQEFLNSERKPCIDSIHLPSTDSTMLIQVKNENEKVDYRPFDHCSELTNEQVSIKVKEQIENLSNEEELDQNLEIKRNTQSKSDINLSNKPSYDLMMVTETRNQNDDNSSISVDEFSQLVKEEFSLDVKVQERFSSNEDESNQKTINEISSNDGEGILEKSTETIVKPIKATRKRKPECKICKKRFRMVEKLEIHMRQHQGLKPFPCLFCKKTYSRRDTLKYHMHDKHKLKLTSTEVDSNINPSNVPKDDNGKIDEEVYPIFLDQFPELDKREKIDYPSNDKKSEDSLEISSEDLFNRIHKMKKTTNTLVRAAFEKDKFNLECEICKQCFKKPDKLERHLRFHKGLAPFPCQLCHKAYSRKNRLTLHIREKHSGNNSQKKEDSNDQESEKSQPCKINEEENSGELIMSTKVKKENLEENLIIPDQYSELVKIELSINENDQMEFSEGEESQQSSNFNNDCDKIAETEETADTVEISDKKSDFQRSTRPYKQRKPRKSFVCEQCGKVLATVNTLKNHLYLHTNQELPHECPQCQKRYITKSLLRRHLDRNVCINYICPYCGVKQKSQKDLKRHMITHSKDKKYPCRLCDLVFYSYGKINKHMQTVHEINKDFTCLYCGKSFSTAEARKHHEIIHTGEKPFGCVICHKKFSRIATLRRHQKVHGRVKK
ncbi:zinc finger protein 107-like [Episyrphus balteatus]|uniref:zinc finger protein 107-like n=1 Tax=Episyrphus balteatus TaxID=286459 RepID=UPI00248552BB|nr:zinc finger protein 107-like [Episyrphus balteatus]